MRCDSHVHIVAPHETHPQVANRTYLAPPAPLSELERVSAPREIKRFVIVQPSFYGADNTMTLEACDALKGRGRAVAVIDPAKTDKATLADFAKRGVRGLRINIYSHLGESTDLNARFSALETIAREQDWHIEVIAPLAKIAECAGLLGRSKVPVVIDHYGVYTGFIPNSTEGRAFLTLVGMPHVWIKLSAPYRSGADALATKPDPGWLAAILVMARNRCVWGSDWPHTPPNEDHRGGAVALPYRKLSYEGLVDDFIAAVGSPELAEQIMSDNPARLYEFD